VGKYILRRLCYVVVVLFIISIFMFAIFQLMPGDPVLHYMGQGHQDLTPTQWQQLYEDTVRRMGFDRPVHIQYTRWLQGMLTGNFGYSMVHRRPVLDVIRTPIFWSVVLNLASMFLIFIVTVPLGIISAIKRGKTVDNGILTFTLVGFSIPSFTVALIVIVIFAVFLGWFPITGMHSPFLPEGQWAQFVDRLQYMAMPLITLTFVGMAAFTRYVRAAMCDALSEDYIRTARSKGLKEKVVVYSHAFRNALIPLITILTGWFMGMFGGSVVIEQLFGWSGMGLTMLQGIMQMDYAIVRAVSLFYAFVAVIAILLMDLAYGLADPRVKVSK